MTSIQYFNTLPFIQALKGFFEDLHIPINILSEVPGSPSTIFKEAFNPQNPTHALMDDVYVLGTVDDMAFTQTRKINENEIKNADYDFLIIVGIVLKKDKKPTRGQLAELTRLCNKIFNSNEKGNPVTVVFRYDDCISFSNAERIVRNGNDYRDGEKLGRVACLKDIQLTKPHAAHQRILAELSIKNTTQTFEGLYEHWRKAFDTKELNKGFFKKIANWYFWGIDQAKFPFQYLRNEEKNALKTDEQLQNIANQKALIRFITRIIFVWFLKEKKLIPETLFEEDFLKNTLKNTDNDAADYYNAILQNLFFATLNRSKDQRAFATDDGFNKNKVNYDVNSLYRYEKMFKNPDPEQIMRLFEEIPFLNGGLFDSLDNKENSLLMDGFSRTKSKRAFMPDRLFFGNETTDFDVKLNEIYDTKSKKYGVKGLFQIFEEYKFTVEENTPLEIDVALDPYLLGEIFENLLAYYNPETSNTARKGTGSFYTPQEIVNYMVDESLKAYLETNVGEINAGRVLNPASVEFDVKFDENTKFKIVKALSEIKILDPACGSGAFPMGVLQRMVQLLTKLDPDNSLWRAIQKEKIIGKKIAELEADKQAIAGLSDAEVRNRAIEAVTERIREVEVIFNNEYNFDDYSRKLFIIQNCIYGVDIQDVAIQISKLRFFLSLIIDQKNEAIKPLPNLETKFVIANTLIGLEMPNEGTFTNYDPTTDKREELRKVREKYFTVTTRKAKNELKTQDANLRNDIAKLIENHYVLKRELKMTELRTQILEWEQRLTDAQALPKEIEIIETTTLFGEKQTTKIDKTKAKIDSVKQRLNGLKIELQKIESHNEVNQIIDTAQKIAHWDIYNQNAQAQWFDMNWMFGITDGFDIVIGNPPYVSISKLKDKDILQKQNFETFESTGDLYSIFYERSNQLLQHKGTLNFITSRQWINAGYGKSTRKFFAEKTNPLQLIDFGKVRIFETATVFVNILMFEKNENLNQMKACLLPENFNVEVNDLGTYFNQKHIQLKNISEKVWKIGEDNVELINQKIEQKGIKLSEWKDIEFFRGVTTGLNPAFHIDEIIKDELIAKDPKSAEVIKPLLRGKDIKRYEYKFEKKYMLFIPWHFPLQDDSSISNASEIAEAAFIKQYPAIYNHLYKFKDELSARNQTETGIRYEWYAMQRYGADFWQNFEEEKIVWIEISDRANFTYDTEGMYLTNSAYFMSGVGLKYILAVLNSRVSDFYFSQITAKIAGGRMRYTKQYVEQIPIPQILPEAQVPFINLVDKILTDKQLGKDTSVLEAEIDRLVYGLYELTEAEIAVVEGR